MIYNIGLFFRYIAMCFLGVKGAWLIFERYGKSRWNTSKTSWTYHIPTKFVVKDSNGNESMFWYTRFQLLTSVHMRHTFNPSPNKRN